MARKLKPGSELSADRSEDWLRRLRAGGYRLTAPRRAVVETVAATRHALSPIEIHEQTRLKYPRLGLVTVYRTLEKLETLGLVERVHHPEGCQAFVPSLAGHQHLLVCERCGRVVYFSGDQLDALIAEVASWSGFRIESHWLQLLGFCSHCN